MLDDILDSNRDELIRRCREKWAERLASTAFPWTEDQGVPIFLRQLAETLRQDAADPNVPDAVPDLAASASPLGTSAALYGTQLMQFGCNVDQVVHAYGDVCQSITDLVVEQGLTIRPREFRTLNRCLDEAIADAVTSFGKRQRNLTIRQADTLSVHLSFFADEHLRLVDNALQAFSAMQDGRVGPGGATGKLLVHSLFELRALTERMLPELRLDSAKTTIPHLVAEPSDAGAAK